MMNLSTRWVNSIFYSLSGGLLIWAICWFSTVKFFKNSIDFWVSDEFIGKGIFLAFVIPSLVIFFLLTVAFHSFSKHNISHLYTLVPDLKPENAAKDIETLSEQISTLTDVKTKEIDLLTEKEIYRREFLGNVSHELKTPLFSIQGFLHTLIDGGMEDENIRYKYLNRIDKSVERLIFIIKDLDMITKLESGELKLNQKPFDIHYLTQEIVDLLEFKAVTNHVNMKIESFTDGPIRVMGDVEKIEQVLTNLIVNAINYSSKENAQITVTFKEVDSKIKTTVRDNGIGMTPDQLERIFERFYRVDKSRSRNSGGSGLGLSIVKHIMEAHDEKINVKSEYLQGTEFSFFLRKVY